MARKHTKTELKLPPTKRQLSRRQRQQRIQRIIVAVAAVFFAFIVCFIGYGYYTVQVKPFHQPVVKINGTVFDMDYYVKLLELYSEGQDDAAVSDAANNLIKFMEYGEAIRRGSPDLGYSVSADEVNSALKSAELPNEKVYRDAVESTLLTNKLLQNYFDPKIPAECEQVNVQALFVGSRAEAQKVADRLKASENFSALAYEYSIEPVTKEKRGDLGWLPKDFAYIVLGDLGGSLLKDIPFSLEPGVLSEPIYDATVSKPLGYWIIEVTEKDEKKGSHVRGILAGSLQEAEDIKARIEAGEDFAALAKEYSQHSDSKENGGDLGWTKDGTITNRVVMGLALPLETGVLSKPGADDSVKTKGGYWLVRVVEKDDNRAIDAYTRQTVRSKLFDDWAVEQVRKNSVETYLTEDQKKWAVDLVLKNRG